MVRSAHRGGKGAGSKIRSEFVDEDACELGKIAGEGRRIPTTRMVVKAEAVVTGSQRRQAADGFFVGMDVEETALGCDGDVGVAPEAAEGGDELRDFVGSDVAADRTLGGLHAYLDLRAAGELLLRLQGIATEFPAEGVGPFAVPVVDVVEKGGTQLLLGVEVAVSQTLTMHDAEE